MTVPTRFIEENEFAELMKIEGDTIPLYKLVAIPFAPPTPDEPDHMEDYPAIRVLFLNVSEPRLYRDRHKVVFVVLPVFADLDFEQARDAHPVKDNVWCYRLTPYTWDTDSDLVLAAYLFPEDTVPPFVLDDVETR